MARKSEKHFVGMPVEVLIHRWRGNVQSDEWETGFVVESLAHAEDRPYRVTCVGNDRRYRECAPECVRAAF